MDIEKIVMIATSIIAALSGGVGILFYTEKKKAQQIANEAAQVANDSKQSEEWRKLYEVTEAKSQAKSEKISQLYEKISRMAGDKVKMAARLSYLSTIKCDNIECVERKPPYGTSLEYSHCSQQQPCGEDCTECKK